MLLRKDCIPICTKGGLNSESFSLGLKFPKTGVKLLLSTVHLKRKCTGK